MNSMMLLDTASMYYRAYHSLPEEMVARDGTPVNAVRGLLERIIRLKNTHNPDLIIAAWDTQWRPQWRVDLIPSYKSHRLEESEDDDEGEVGSLMPDNLSVQIPIIEEVLTLLGIPVVGHDEYEADDVIGTYASLSNFTKTDVVTGDRDLFQVIDDNRGISVLYTAKGEIQNFDGNAVLSKYGIGPHQYVDFSILRGDPSDGLPGVSGIGEKTAAKLISHFETLENVIFAAQVGDKEIKPKITQSILNSIEYIEAAQKVVPVVRNVPVPEINNLNFTHAPVKILTKLADELNLKSTLSKAIHSFRIS
jgi:5'-3' exonuclease